MSRKDLNPPQWVDSLIDEFSPPRLAEEIRGDLYELFQKDIAERGLGSARYRYAFHGLGFLTKRFFWRMAPSTSNPFIMMRSYFRMAARSLSTYRGTAFINMLGLIIGIASALVIFTVVRFELGFNKSHSDTERIYRIVRVSGDDMSEFRTGVSYPVPDAIKGEVSALEEISSVQYFGGAYVDILNASGKSDAMFREEHGCVFVEPSFFRIFDFKESGFKWIEGNPEKALVEPYSAVLTESMARKYFPEGNAVGNIIRIQKRYDMKVTGVVSDLPADCDFPFTILISYASLNPMNPNSMDNWFSVNDSHQTYIKLNPGVTADEMEDLIAGVHARHTPKELHQSRHYLLQRLTDMHYEPRFGTYSGRTITKETILALIIIGAFLLLTASINYINLSTAQSAMRSKEIGLRKVMGSTRKNLVAQFMTETLILVFLAGVIAIGVAELMVINAGSLVNLNMQELNFVDPVFLISFLLIIIVLTLFAGFYPSLVISRFNPVNALKNKFSADSGGKVTFRKVLVVAQFTITQMLVVGTFIVVSQMKFFREVNMGFNREAIINLRLPSTSLRDVVPTISNQLSAETFVSGFTFSSTIPSGVVRNRSYMDIGKTDAAQMKDYVVFEYQAIDSSYLDVYGIRLLAGRPLRISDSTGNVIINKKLMQAIGFNSPEQVLNSDLKMGGGRIVTVVGVVDDFYSNSMKEAVDYMVFTMDPGGYDYCSIKVNVKGDESMSDALKRIEAIWKNTYPEHLFGYQFFDDNIAAFYAQEEKYAKLFQIFSLIFLFIGCLGLYGLITFVVTRKSREVAIRKVLGATVSNILVLFSTEYIRLIILSFLLAAPIAYYFVNEWLSGFASHIAIKWWFFVLPGLMVLIIALFVVVTRSFTSANANPVDKLKYE